MSLRVVHIISGLGIGGAERHLVNLLNAMSCEYRAAIFVGEKQPGASFYGDLDAAIEQHFIRVRRRSLPLGIFRLASVLKKNRVTVVHTHMYTSNLYGTIAARLAGVPVVVTTEHGENPWKRPYQRWLERNVISRFADMRFCVSPQILEIRRDVDGIPANRLRLTINGTVVPPSSAGNKAASTPVVGAVGRFIPAKDYPGLLRAIALLRDRGYELTLCILGDGPEADKVKSLITEMKLNDIVRLPGMVSDVDSWYRQFDVYVSSSIREGQPVALLEAMAHALPVVATDVGASAETVIDGEGGLIVPPGDPRVLAESIGRLLDEPALRCSLGQSARRRVMERYSVAKVADDHVRIYQEILSSNGRGR